MLSTAAVRPSGIQKTARELRTIAEKTELLNARKMEAYRLLPEIWRAHICTKLDIKDKGSLRLVNKNFYRLVPWEQWVRYEELLKYLHKLKKYKKKVRIYGIYTRKVISRVYSVRRLINVRKFVFIRDAPDRCSFTIDRFISPECMSLLVRRLPQAEFEFIYNEKDGPFYFNEVCYAVKSNNLELVRFLHQAKPDHFQRWLNAQYDRTRISLLIVACQSDNTEIAEFLIEAGADVNYANNLAHTPLSTALENENKSLALFLVAHGAESWLSKRLLKRLADYQRS